MEAVYNHLRRDDEGARRERTGAPPNICAQTMLRVACWLAVVARVRGDEFVYGSNVTRWWNSPDAPPTFATLQDAVTRHLRPEDLKAFETATGSSVAGLLEDVKACDANATRAGAKLPHEALPVVMSTKKVVPHRLNARGLHAFRAMLATRIMHRRPSETLAR